MTDKIIAYHFLRDDMRSGSGNEPAWTVGESRSLKGGRITPCERGYHASPSLFNALAHAPGSMACMVELSGTVKPHGDPLDKYAARSRRLIAAVNIEYELRMFAADCAEHVLYLFERDYPNDNRPRKAIEAARAFANGEIDALARAAAWDAARAAAWGAVGAAAWAAARAAAWDAAGGAVGAAAWDAARAAAWDAAGGAERGWQRATFDSWALHVFDGVAP